MQGAGRVPGMVDERWESWSHVRHHSLAHKGAWSNTHYKWSIQGHSRPNWSAVDGVVQWSFPVPMQGSWERSGYWFLGQQMAIANPCLCPCILLMLSISKKNALLQYYQQMYPCTKYLLSLSSKTPLQENRFHYQQPFQKLFHDLQLTTQPFFFWEQNLTTNQWTNRVLHGLEWLF